MSSAVRRIRATLALVVCLAPAVAVADQVPATVPAAYATQMRLVNPHLHAETSRAYASALLSSAQRLHVDPTLVMAVVTVESHWNARAVSIHGARGLGQLKPETARELGVNAWSGRGNLRGVAAYLHRMLGLFKTSRYAIREAIASYNAGPFAVRSAGGIPANGQTPRYVAKVMTAWRTFKLRLGNHPTAAAVAAELDQTRAVEHAQAAYWGAD